MIAPTVGRVVWYRPGMYDLGMLSTQPEPPLAYLGDGPLAAIITHVWSDTCVNLTVFDSNAVSHPRTSVCLHQGDGPRGDRGSSPYCEWMPFQKGQASKTEAVERALADTTEGRDAALQAKANAEARR